MFVNLLAPMGALVDSDLPRLAMLAKHFARWRFLDERYTEALVNDDPASIEVKRIQVAVDKEWKRVDTEMSAFGLDPTSRVRLGLNQVRAMSLAEAIREGLSTNRNEED